jgi:hypothetical protein
MRAAVWLLCLACTPSAGTDPVVEPETDTPAGPTEDSEVPTDDTDRAEPLTSVIVGPEIVCADPALRATLGPYTSPEARGDWANQLVDPARATLFQGGGLSVADFDGDGVLDVVLPGVEQTQLLFGRPDGAFVDVSATHLPEGSHARAASAIPADPDGDGDLDLYVARYNEPDLYWRNLGDGAFEDATAAAGLDATPVARSTAASWADYDGDDDLDLFVGTFGPFFSNPRPPGDPSVLWENLGDGTFAHRGDLLPQEVHDGWVFVGGWYDLDEDGDRDLYTVHDFGDLWPNVLAWNEGGTFRADDGSAGLNVGLQGMGLSWGDLNGDGLIDLAMASWSANAAMIGVGPDTWFDAATVLGLQPDRPRGQEIGWASVLADLDNDGDLDMAQGYGHIYNQDAPADQPDELYVQQEDGAFRPEGAAWGFNHLGQTRGVLAVDLDGDGWLDLLRRDLTGPATLQYARCGAEAWTRLRLEDKGPNRFAVGAEVRLWSGDRQWSRVVHAGGESVLSAGPTELHVGLGAAHLLDRVEVRWPDGERSLYEDLPVRRLLTIRRESLE